jgi:hypothetical protein
MAGPRYSWGTAARSARLAPRAAARGLFLDTLAASTALAGRMLLVAV